MTRFGRAAISAAGILVALILVGVAAAGNGNGNGNGKGAGNGAEHAAEAPGQVKKDVPAAAPQSAPVAAPVSAPVVTAASTPAAPAAPAASSPADPGVKPSNTTSKNTSCVTGHGSGGATCTGGSKPDSSKQYGNGTTAAQIATSRGGNGVTLKGPGNSQPHKVVACGRRHAVDVHAVKHYNANACAETPTPTPDPKPNPTPDPSPNPTPNPSPNPTPPGDPGNPPSTPSPHGHISGAHVDSSVRVLGDPARQTHKRSSKPASAVLSEVAAAVPVLHGTLPFTGLPLWTVVLVAIGLIAIGVALRTPGALTRVHAPRRTDRRGSDAA